MTEKKVVRTIKLLSKKELLELDIFMSSEYFNQNKKLQLVYFYLKKYTSSSIENIDLENYILNCLKKKNELMGLPSIVKYLSKTYHLILDFIAFENFKNEPFLKQFELLKGFCKPLRKEQFNKLYATLKSKLNSEKDSVIKFKRLHELEELAWAFKSNFEDDRTDDCNLGNKIISFQKYYTADLLKASTLILNRKKIVAVEISSLKFNELIKNYKVEDFKNEPFTKAWYLAYLLIFKNDNEEKKQAFEFLKLHLEKFAPDFNNAEAQNLYAILRNEAQYYFEDRNDLYLFLFNTYNKLIANKILFVNEKLNFQTIKSIVTVGTKLNKLDWLLQFIEDHRNKISPKKIANDVCDYNLARINFIKKEYKKTSALLTASKIKDIFYKLSITRLELMLLYELKEWAYLDSKINAFKIFVHRKKKLSEEKKSYQNKFIFYLKKILTAKQNVNLKKEKLQKIKEELQYTKNILEKDWLLQKIKEIELTFSQNLVQPLN